MKRLHQIVFFVLASIALGWLATPGVPLKNHPVIQYKAAATIAQPLVHLEDTPEVYGVMHGNATFSTVLQQANIVLLFFGCASILVTGKAPRPLPNNALSPYLRYIYPFHGFW